jgi:diguanylate cyclase (GGDEF)-like protein
MRSPVVTEPSDPNLSAREPNETMSQRANPQVFMGDGGGIVPDPVGWTDTLTGAEGPKYWDRLISGEKARHRRSARPVTVVLLELVGCEELASAIGREGALQVFARLSRALVSQMRTSDHIARVGRNRFALLLPETDELQAVNFIDRVLAHLRDSIAREGIDVHIGIGWASPAPSDRLTDAIGLAEERLASDFFDTL